MAECEHGSPPNACPVASCNPRGQRTPDIGPPFEAQFDGLCRAPHCGDSEIEEGDTLRMVDGTAWHDRCASIPFT